jgi:carboxylesterase type B
VGNLRFKAPVPPTGRNKEVQTGAQGRICPQASPLWGAIGQEFEIAFIEGNATAFNLSAAEAQLAASLGSAPQAPAPSPDETEDCLFLDVFVPKKVFDNRNTKGKKAAVLLW